MILCLKKFYLLTLNNITFLTLFCLIFILFCFIKLLNGHIISFELLVNCSLSLSLRLTILYLFYGELHRIKNLNR